MFPFVFGMGSYYGTRLGHRIPLLLNNKHTKLDGTVYLNFFILILHAFC